MPTQYIPTQSNEHTSGMSPTQSPSKTDADTQFPTHLRDPLWKTPPKNITPNNPNNSRDPAWKSQTQNPPHNDPNAQAFITQKEATMMFEAIKQLLKESSNTQKALEQQIVTLTMESQKSKQQITALEDHVLGGEMVINFRAQIAVHPTINAYYHEAQRIIQHTIGTRDQITYSSAMLRDSRTGSLGKKEAVVRTFENALGNLPGSHLRHQVVKHKDTKNVDKEDSNIQKLSKTIHSAEEIANYLAVYLTSSRMPELTASLTSDEISEIEPSVLLKLIEEAKNSAKKDVQVIIDQVRAGRAPFLNEAAGNQSSRTVAKHLMYLLDKDLIDLNKTQSKQPPGAPLTFSNHSYSVSPTPFPASHTSGSALQVVDTHSKIQNTPNLNKPKI